MNKRIDFTLLDGFPLTQDTLKWMQESYRDALGAIATLFGDYVILTGVTDLGAEYSDGWVAINGEILPFIGGTKAANIITEEIATAKQFADASSKDVWFLKRAKSGSVGGEPHANFVRLSTIKSLTQLKAPLASPTFTGTPAAPTAAPGTNTTQLATTAFVAAVQEALQENQSSLKQTIINIGDWNMDVDSNRIVAHGLANHKNVRGVHVMIRNDADTLYIPLTGGWGLSQPNGGVLQIDSANIHMDRSPGIFDNPNYSSTGYNRGFITFTHL